MLIFSGKRYGFSYSQIWFPEEAGLIRREMDAHTLVQVFHAKFDADSCGLKEYCSHWRDFWTTTISLKASKEELHRQLEPKSCRYEIRKAEKLEHSITVNERLDDARQLIENFIQRSGYRHTLSDTEWEGYRGATNVHTIYHNGSPIATHVVLLDPPHKVRLIMSATRPRDDEDVRHLIGPFNRKLHWEEFLYYKSLGYSEYDFGGIARDPSDPCYAISKFKLSFGGPNVKQNDFFLIKNPIIRIGWRTARAAKAKLQPYLKKVRALR
jgi:lipid II:glycine glycyltransferase (peptidoglycan interpeptide bridge formation enzyme)